MVDILLVDDSAVTINEVSFFLKENGIDSLIAANGKEGFELLMQRRDIPLAIVDVNMPVLDGFSMIAKVRAEAPDCATKFVMLTTEFDRASKDRGKALGVKGWIIKPFKGETAIEAIKKLINNG